MSEENYILSSLYNNEQNAYKTLMSDCSMLDLEQIGTLVSRLLSIIEGEPNE